MTQEERILNEAHVRRTFECIEEVISVNKTEQTNNLIILMKDEHTKRTLICTFGIK